MTFIVYTGALSRPVSVVKESVLLNFSVMICHTTSGLDLIIKYFMEFVRIILADRKI